MIAGCVYVDRQTQNQTRQQRVPDSQCLFASAKVPASLIMKSGEFPVEFEEGDGSKNRPSSVGPRFAERTSHALGCPRMCPLTIPPTSTLDTVASQHEAVRELGESQR